MVDPVEECEESRSSELDVAAGLALSMTDGDVGVFICGSHRDQLTRRDAERTELAFPPTFAIRDRLGPPPSLPRA
jgi:hypothetical protein